jgi:hypothetical protein
VPATVRGASSLSFSATDQLGVYEVTPIGLAPTAAPSGSSLAAPTPTASAASPGSSASPSSSAGSPGPSQPPSEAGPVRFAVDLFDAGESDIAPGSAAALAALGTGTTGGSPAPGASGASPAAPSAPATAGPGASGAPAGGGTTAARQPARDELWIPVVLVVLLVLTIEWLVYQRDAVTRLWRGVRRRDPAGTGRGT